MAKERGSPDRGLIVPESRVHVPSQKLLAPAVESAPVGIVVVDGSGAIVFLNRETERIFGYSRDELIGGPIERLIPLRYVEHHRGLRADFSVNPTSHVMGGGRDLLGLRKDGTEIPVEVGLNSFATDEGVFVLAFLADISVRKRAESALRATRDRLHQVLASSTAVLYSTRVTEKGFYPSWVSENITRLMGYEVREALQPGWWLDCLHPDDRSLALVGIQRLFIRGRLSLDYRFRHKSGTYRWVHDESRLVRDAAEQPTEVYGAWLDITERKQLEEQFRQAQKMEAIGRLAGGVAHDFNNLLTVITSYTELLLNGADTADPRQKDLEEIRKASHAAAGLTRQLLAFSRRQLLEPKVLELNEVVGAAGKMLQRLIGEDVALVNVLAPELGAVKADPGQVEQVMMNLAVNARDAMPHGGKLTIETANVQLDSDYADEHHPMPAGAYVLLTVSDIGVGMEEETQRRIFEPFFTTKEPGKGTGLGLATVYGIVKQSDGFVWVYSEVGLGTTFKIYLPRIDHRADAKPDPPVLPESLRGTETVLVAEDAAAVRDVVRQVLQRNGYTVLEAPNGQAALDLVAKHRGGIDLLITDVIMPEMSGRQLAERLQEQRPVLKVLFVSGYTDDAIVRHGVLEAGIAFLQKPFTPEALARKAREVLDSPTTRK